MRVVFASLASVGHAYPMVPLAIGLRAAGHEVHFAVGEEVHDALAVHGLRPFRPADVFYEMYAEDLEPDLKRLRPDLVVNGWSVPGAAEAADRVGVSRLWHGFGRMYPDTIGLPVPPADGRPHVDICPPSLQEERFRSEGTRIELRPVPYPTAGPSTCDVEGTVVYLTLGTAFGTAELLRTAIAGLARLDAHVVVALGRVPADELGPVPHRVAAHRWVDQAQLLARADLVVHHGGSGTTLGAAAAGVPQLVLPQGADQFANAEALCTNGVARRLLPDEVSADAVTESATSLLRYPQHSDAARSLATEIAHMPGPDEVARQLVA